MLTIIGGLYTLYRIRLGWDSTRRKLFLKYMRAEETKIDDRKGPVARRLQDAKRISIVPEDLDVHAAIDKAIGKFDKGDLEEAENLLKDLNSRLSHRISFAEKQMRLAEKPRAQCIFSSVRLLQRPVSIREQSMNSRRCSISGKMTQMR